MFLHPWNFPGKSTGVGCHFLLQGIFPTWGSNLCLSSLLHWQAGSLPLVPPGKPTGSTGLYCFTLDYQNRFQTFPWPKPWSWLKFLFLKVISPQTRAIRPTHYMLSRHPKLLDSTSYRCNVCNYSSWLTWPDHKPWDQWQYLLTSFLYFQ